MSYPFDAVGRPGSRWAPGAVTRVADARRRALVERGSDAFALLDARGRVLYASPATFRILGHTARELVGRGAVDLVHAADQAAAREWFALSLLGSEAGGGGSPASPLPPGETIQVRCRHRDGSWRWLEGTATDALDQPGVRAVVVNYRDVTERRRAEQHVSAQLAVARVLVEAADLAEAAPKILQALCDTLEWQAGGLFLRDPAAARLRWTAGVSGELVVPDAFHATPRTLRSGEGMAGLAWQTGSPVWVADLESLRYDPHAALAVAEGMRAALAFPITVGDDLLGVIELYTRDARPADDLMSGVVATIGCQIGQFAMRRAAEAALARSRAELSRRNGDLHALSCRLVETQEQERRHLARALHDEVGQVLTGLKLALEMARRPSDQSDHGHLSRSLGLVNDLIARVREFSLELRPAMLDDLGLLPALLWHFDRAESRGLPPVRFEHAGLDRRFPPVVETAAYRIVQEALGRFVTSGEFARGPVTVRVWTADALLCVQAEGPLPVEEGGASLPHEGEFDLDPDSEVEQEVSGRKAAPRLGVRCQMRERAILLGGRFRMERTPGQGARLTAELPI